MHKKNFEKAIKPQKEDFQEEKYLPTLFWQRLSEIYTKEEISSIKEAFSLPKRKTSFRINTITGTSEEVEAELKNKKLLFSKLTFPENCYILESGKESDLWELDVYKKGKIYIQSIASQIPVHLMELSKGQIVADLAAAPGGKTSQLAEFVGENGKIVATEIQSIRSQKLAYNMKKLSCENVEVLTLDAHKLSEKYKENNFDAILFDAPCSGEGTINFYREKSYNNWKESHIKRNYERQKAIIDATLPLLKSGGVFLYSTCTLAPEENEGIVHYILCNHNNLEIQDIEIPLSNSKPGIKKFKKYIYTSGVEKSKRIIPNTEMEGFFIAKFKKK